MARSRPLLDAWPVLIALVICLPLLTRGGHPLARDLVFVPHQPWTDASSGLGGRAPSGPLDALVALLTRGARRRPAGPDRDPADPGAAGWGAHRLVGRTRYDGPARRRRVRRLEPLRGGAAGARPVGAARRLRRAAVAVPRRAAATAAPGRQVRLGAPSPGWRGSPRSRRPAASRAPRRLVSGARRRPARGCWSLAAAVPAAALAGAVAGRCRPP